MFSYCSINQHGVSVATLGCFFSIIANLTTWLLMFSGIVTVVLIIYSGIKLILSGGDPKNIQESRKILLYAVLGLIIILMAFAVILLIATLTGVACISPNFPYASPSPFTTCN